MKKLLALVLAAVFAGVSVTNVAFAQDEKKSDAKKGDKKKGDGKKKAE